MKRKGMSRRFLALFVMLCMVFTMIPAMALASEENRLTVDEFTGDYVVEESATYDDVEVVGGSTLTINEGVTLTVTSGMILDGGHLVVVSGAALSVNNNIQVIAEAEKATTVSGLTFHFWEEDVPKDIAELPDEFITKEGDTYTFTANFGFFYNKEAEIWELAPGGVPECVLELEVLEVYEPEQCNTNGFSYRVGGVSPTPIALPIDEGGRPSPWDVGDLSSGAITITYTKPGNQPFWGFKYTMDRETWYSTSNEAEELRSGDNYEVNGNEHTLTIAREGNEGVRVEAYINSPVDVWCIDNTVEILNTEESHDRVDVVNGGSLTIAEGGSLTARDIILDNGALEVQDGGTLNADRIEVICGEHQSVTITGLTLWQSFGGSDAIGEITNLTPVQGITKDDDTGTYTFTENKRIFFDREPTRNKWVLEGGSGEPGDSQNPGESQEPEPLTRTEELLRFLCRGWGVENKGNSVETATEDLVNFIWTALQTEENGKYKDVYANKEALAACIVVESTLRNIDQIIGLDSVFRDVVHYPFEITVSIPGEESKSSFGALYLLPQGFILMKETQSGTLDNWFLWPYVDSSFVDTEPVVRDDANPEHYEPIGARCSNRRVRGGVGIVQIEGMLVNSLQTMTIFEPSFAGVCVKGTETKHAPEWGLGNEGYVDFAKTTKECPAELEQFFGERTLAFPVKNVKDTMGNGATITNISVVSDSGIPSNVISYNNESKTVQFNTDFYTEVPLRVDYTLASGETKVGYVTVTRSGITLQGILKPGDSDGTCTVLHGAASSGVTFDWGEDTFALYATYYVDNALPTDVKVSLFAKLIAMDGSEQDITVEGTYIEGSEDFVASYDFEIYKGKDNLAEVLRRVEIIAYAISKEDDSCLAAFSGEWEQ